MTSAAFKDVFGEYVMLALTGDTWKRHRKLITPLFTQSRLKKFSNFMFEVKKLEKVVI
jgi:cytochrome P450